MCTTCSLLYKGSLSGEGGLCPGVSVQGVSVLGGSMSSGVSVWKIPPDRQTDAREKITLLQTSFVGSNDQNKF